MEWFRWYHGTVADPKFSIIAKRSKQPRHVVVACWPSLLEFSSSRDDRGTLDGIDLEEVAIVLDLETEQVEAVYQAMVDKGMIVDDRLKSWSKRQPKREDEHSYERLKLHRENKKHSRNVQNDNADETHDNADETHETRKTLEQSRAEQTLEQSRTEQTLKAAAAFEKMKLSEIEKLYVKHLHQLVNGQASILQDICKEYPPKDIIEAFESADANGIRKLNWVRQRLKGRQEDVKGSDYVKEIFSGGTA